MKNEQERGRWRKISENKILEKCAPKTTTLLGCDEFSYHLISSSQENKALNTYLFIRNHPPGLC